MARISRMCYESSFFHVMVQGINKENIYEKGYMKKAFLNILNKKSKELNVEILAFCIMDSHVHLLLYTENIHNLTKLMASINTKYAKLFNKVNDRVGYVYRDRYRCENIYTENHLINCIKYIHNNPVNAHMCDYPKYYKYSSYYSYLKNKKINKLIVPYVDEILSDTASQEIKYIDVNDEFGSKLDGNVDEVIRDYIMKHHCRIEELSDLEINELSKAILKTCKITKSELAHRLGIERTKWYRIMKIKV